MATEITAENRAALEPLYRSWDEPNSHRIPNPLKGGPAIAQPGRRPSRCPLVRSLRAQVDDWRRAGYPGASETSNTLLTHWFDAEQTVKDEDGNDVPFRYHWAQREAIETIIFLYELRGIRNVAALLSDFGEGQLDDIAAGIAPEDDRWAKYCCKVATGGGKTKVMSLAIVWSYFHSMREPDSDLAQHFVLVAPNLTVYERLKDDFENCSIFTGDRADPLIPEDWKQDFQMQVVLQEEPGGSTTTGAVYLTNIHRLYPSKDGNNDELTPTSRIFGPEVKKAQALDTSVSLRERITSHPKLMVLNDEAHHLHDPELAWNRAIESLHKQSLGRGNGGICMQLDFTATPKHNDGSLFRHIVCDFPLGEAVDAGIVKVPVLGEAPEIPPKGFDFPNADARYSMHLKLGYQLYEQSFAEFHKVRKPILFVMTEDKDAANDIARYLDSDQFPLLKGRVLNIHTRLKGTVKTVTRFGRELKEFVESESGMKPEDLRALREMSRELDAKDSKFRCVVSVMMLREGWDVRNVTTIVPLRPYSAKSGILPEQTLGRGLRRMFPSEPEQPEKVVVVHHQAFRDLYESELQQEGLDIAVLPIRDVFKETVTIFVDHENKSVEELEIEIPLISDSIETTTELNELSFDDLRDVFKSRYKPLPIGLRREGEISYEERHLFTDEVVARMKLDAGLLGAAYSAPAYFAQMLGKACRISNPHKVLEPLIERFIAEVLFERPVNPYGGDVDHRMRDADVLEHIRATFAPLIIDKTVTTKDRKRLSMGARLSTWKPFQATSTVDRPSVPAKRTMFNLVPCTLELEQAFVDFCDYASDVAAFAKNTGPQKLMIDYLRPDGHRALYVPDFIVRTTAGTYKLVELKGKTDELVPFKARASNEWCKTASKDVAWDYLYIPYLLFQQSSASAIEDLARACTPSLKDLVHEARTRQAALPLEEETAKAHIEDVYAKTLRESGVAEFPAHIDSVVRQAVSTLDDAITKRYPTFGSAFQPFLGPIDDLCLKIIVQKLSDHVPADQAERDYYFDPVLDRYGGGTKATLEKHQRWLKDNLVHGRRMQLLATLLFCLRYAHEWDKDVGGVWDDVRDEFSNKVFADLLEVLDQVNADRNKRIAHVEVAISDPTEAWEIMRRWTMCLAALRSQTH
jgi:type III restriction enzyme